MSWTKTSVNTPAAPTTPLKRSRLLSHHESSEIVVRRESAGGKRTSAINATGVPENDPSSKVRRRRHVRQVLYAAEFERPASDATSSRALGHVRAIVAVDRLANHRHRDLALLPPHDLHPLPLQVFVRREEVLHLRQL